MNKGESFRVVAVRDITERKRSEKALKESEERFRTVLEGLSGGVFAHDLEGRFVLVNEAACRNTGYTREELLQKHVKDIDPSSLGRDDRTHLWHRLHTGTSTRIESAYVRKDGSEYPAEIYLNAIVLEGKPTILGIAYDTTEKK